MQIYFDYAATGMPDPQILDYYREMLERYPANPSSTHADGREARQAIEKATASIAGLLGADPSEVVYTSGGSESINTAVHSAALETRARPGLLLTFAGEHEATAASLAFYADLLGMPLEVLPLRQARPDLAALEQVLEARRGQLAVNLLTNLYVHNLSGAIYPEDEIVSLTRRLAPTARIHLDAVQALGKLPIDFHSLGVDFLSLSLHKIGTPRGIGLLLARRSRRLIPLIHGGGQQNKRRSGTENTALILAAARALEKMESQREASSAKVRELHEQVLAGLAELGEPYRLLCPADAVPQIISIYLPALRGQVVQTALSAAHLDLGIGSACSSSKNKGDPALLALGLTPEESRHVIRISLSAANSSRQVGELLKELHQLLQGLRTEH